MARVNVESVGDMGIEYVVAESGMTAELIVDDVGERSRYALKAADERFKPSGHFEDGCGAGLSSDVHCSTSVM